MTDKLKSRDAMEARTDVSARNPVVGFEGSEVLARTKFAVIRLEMIADRVNLLSSYQEVKKNNGAAGVDRQSVADVERHSEEILERLHVSLLDGSYRPGDIRRVWIPKSGGGERGLGIPNVVDRIVQQSIYRVLLPEYDKVFCGSSHGFRPGKNCHTAIQEAATYVEAGYEYVVDIDLERFFDTVNHERLMSRLRREISDPRVLKLIHRIVRSDTVLPDGVKVRNENGVPQGGPLSPLLSNIVLDELDRELLNRGHKFVRYADDCNIYVRSQRAGERVMASVSGFIERRMRLKVNREKSAVSKPEHRHFLGFSLGKCDGEVKISLSERTKSRISEKIKELTPRNWGGSLKSCIERINRYLSGWMAYFRICSESEIRRLSGYDAHVRRRLRAIKLKQWRRRRTIAKALISLGVNKKTAWRRVYQGKKSLWALSYDYVANRGLRNAYFAELGLKSLQRLWHDYRQKLTASSNA